MRYEHSKLGQIITQKLYANAPDNPVSVSRDKNPSSRYGQRDLISRHSVRWPTVDLFPKTILRHDIDVVNELSNLINLSI